MRISRSSLGRLSRRMNKPAQTISDLFMGLLRKRDAALQEALPTTRNELLMEAVQNGNQIIERLALFGAALNANLTAIERKIGLLSEVDPEFVKKLDEQIGGLVGIRQAFLSVYNDESVFCTQFEQMVRHRILAEAGIDPNDTEAAMAHLIALGKAQVVPVHDPSSN